MNKNRLPRLVRAYLRDTWVLVRRFRLTLLFFILLLVVGTVVLRLTYSPPLRWMEAMDAVVKLMFFETTLAYPVHPLAQAVYFLWPFLGIVVAVEGVVRFTTALFARQERRDVWEAAVASTYRNHIVVCGLGKVGYRVAGHLLRMQQDVVGVEIAPQSFFIERIRKNKVPVVVGDARDRGLLEKAGIKEAATVVACTGDDLTNLQIALEARQANPTIRVVMRMFDEALADDVRQGFGIQTVFSTSALAAPALAAAATRAAIEYSFYVNDVLLNVSRITVAEGSSLVGRTVGAVEQEADLSVILHEGPTGVDMHPAADKVLTAGDRIVVFGTLEALACLSQMNVGEGACPPRRSGLFSRRRGRE